MIIDIKPLSINRAWGGRTFKSKLYKQYEKDLSKLLRPMNVPDGELELYLKFGFSSKASDFDNPVKPFVDCLQRQYGFNDKHIKRAVIEVEHVKKGREFVEFKLKQLNEG